MWQNAAGHGFLAKPEPLLGSIAAAIGLAILFTGVWSGAVIALTRIRQRLESPTAA